jgi:hypothetical protein
MPKFQCWIPDYGHEPEDGKEIDAYDAEGAAAMFMEYYEARSAEYPVASGETQVVAVSQDGQEPVMFSVWGEARPTYYARAQRKGGGDAA